ncbi:MAG: hypothetical protein ACRDMZ_24470, partial [Solirubrobacteraceae bacterium]
PEPPPAAAAPAARDETAATEVVARRPRPASEAATGRASRASRTVTREDARQLTFDDPSDEPPLRPDEIPRAGEGG